MPLNPALGDAYRNIVVTTGTGSGGVPGTTTARAVDAQFNLDAGYGISLIADPLNNKVTVVNTGNGTGALTTITDINSNGNYYPIFTRGPTTTITFTTGASDYVSATRPANVAELRITGTSNSPTGVSYALRTALAGLLPGETFQAVRVSDTATINFTVGTAAPINGIPQSSATYSTVNGYWTVVITGTAGVAETYSSITVPTGVGDINPVTGTYQMDTMYLDQTTTPLTYNPSSGTLTFVNSIVSTILVGTSANFTDWPNAKLVASQADSGHSHTYNFGIVGEAVASSSDTNLWGVGVYGKGNANVATRGAGLLGDGGVTNTTDTAAAVGVRGYATEAHTGGDNVAIFAVAQNSSTNNYALYMSDGNIFSGTGQSWTLADNNASALSFNGGATSILKLVSTTGSKGVTMGGTLGVTGATTLSSTLGVTVTSSSDALSVTYNPASTSGAAISATGKDSNGGVGYFDFLKVTNTTSGATNSNKWFRLNSTGTIEIINSAYGATIFGLSDAGRVTVEGVTSTGATGTGRFVFDTAPAILGGTHTGLTSLGVRDTSAAFDVTLAATSSLALTAGRALTFDVENASRTIALGGNIDIANNLTTSGNFPLTLTTTATTNVTFPSGTVTLAASNQTMFIGTTNVVINRTSANLALTGITSIDGYAGGLAGGNNTTLLGAIPYQSNANTTSLLSPNTTVTKNFLTMTGTGANGAVPSWGTLAAADIPAFNLGTTSITFNRASAAQSLTGITSIDGYAAGLTGGVIGSIPYQSAANTTLFVAGNTTTTPQFLTSTGTGSAAQAPTLTGSTGTGNVVLATNPTITSPTGGNSSSTADADATVDAAANTFYAYVQSASGTARTINISNLTAGRAITLYLRNTNVATKTINITASTTTSGFTAVNMSKGDAGGTSVTSVTLSATSGTAMVTLFNANGTFAGAID
jgi:hypothetical protein